MENVWAEAMTDKFDDVGNLIEKGKDVKVQIRPVFSGDELRPSDFLVDYWIDGKKTTRNFPNQ
jgi:hypoxanthine-guanine phosphoribosyltransferase